MKKAIYLFFAGCVACIVAVAQEPGTKKFELYYGQPAITKKVSELRADALSRSAMPRPRAKEKMEFDMRAYKNPGAYREGQKTEKAEHQDESALDSSTAAEELPVSATPKIWSNFLATTFEENPQFVPPDPTGAVGSTQVTVVSNDMMKVFEKRAVTDPPLTSYKGTLHTPAPSQLAISLYEFFYPVLTDGYPGDVQVRFDRLTRRWMISGTEFFQSMPGNNILLAVSDGDRISDETNFRFYKIPSDLLPHSNESGAPFFDNPRLGVDSNNVLIGASNFFTHTDSCGTLFYDSLYSVGLAIDKRALIRGFLRAYVLKLGAWQFTQPNSGFGMLFPRGVYNDNPTAPKSFFAGINFTGTAPNAGDAIVLASLTFDDERFLIDFSEMTIPVGPFQQPRNVAALGSPLLVDASDARLVDAAIYKNKLTGKSSLWTSHVIGVNQAGEFVSFEDYYQQARTAARWYEIGNIYTKPRIVQSGTVYDAVQKSGRRAVSYFNTSIVANGQGQAVLCGTTAAYNRYLNVFVAGRNWSDAHGTLSAPQKATATRGMYALTNRWGDYSQAVVDPFDNQTIWSFQDYAASDDNFGVRAVQLKAPPPATPLPLDPVSNKDNVWVTVKGVSVDESGFFDPGSDKGGPGYNRLSVKATGGLIVSSIRFISPTELRFWLNAKNKPAGNYTLVITNPDGQLVTTELTIFSKPLITLPVTNTQLQKEMEIFSAASRVVPNPTTGIFTLQITAPKDWTARVLLMAASGKQLSESRYALTKGMNAIPLSVAGYANGTYLVAVYNEKRMLIAVEKIVKE